MNISNFPIRLIGAAVLTLAASAAHATFTFGTIATGGNSNATAASYAASVSGARDAFNDLTIDTDLGVASLNRLAYPGPASYTLTTQGNLFVVQSPGIGGPAISVLLPSDSLLFNNFGGINPTQGIRNFGASVYLSELTAGNAVAGTFSAKATDVNGLVQTYAFAQGSSGGAATLYFTLASTVALQSIEFIAPVSSSFATVDNVVVGAVPLPAAGWLLMSSLGGMAFFKRRRA